MVTLLLVACLVAILGAGVAGRWWIEERIQAEKAAIEDQVRAFVTAPDPDTPSPFAQLVVGSLDRVLPDLANAVAMSLKTSLMGQASGIARGSRAMEMELQAGAIGDNPLAQMAAGVFEKQIRKNPMLGMGLQALISKMGQGPGSSGAVAPGTGSARPAYNYKSGFTL